MEKDWHARGDLAEAERLKDWLESQATIMSFWIDRMVERADEKTLSQLEAHKQGLTQLITQLG